MSDNKGKSMKKQSFIIKVTLAVIVMIFAAMVGFNFYKDKMTANYLANQAEPVHPVTVETLNPNRWIPLLQTSSTIRPNQGAMLKSQMAGMVAEVLIQAGENVQKGDVLVRLDTSVEKAQLNALKAQLTAVKQTYLSYEKLYKTQSVSKQALDEAKAQYDALMANITALEATIDRRQIVAPFSGIAGIVKVNVGEFINAGTDIVRVEDRSQMKVDFGVAQNDIVKLRLGQKIVAFSDSYPGKAFSATVTAIDPAINQATGLIDVQATFDNSNDLLSGMFVRLNLQLAELAEQIVIPQIAISYNMYGNFIYVLEPLKDEDKQQLLAHPMFAAKAQINEGHVFRAKQVAVNVIDRQGAKAQLEKANLNFGEKIVVGGIQRLNNGSLIVIKDKALVGTTDPETIGNL